MMSGYLEVRDPRSGRCDETVGSCTPEELPDRIARLRRAQPGWHALGYEGRAKALGALGDLLRHSGDEVRRALERDTGRRALSVLEAETISNLCAALASGTLRPADAEWVRGRSMPTVRHRAELHPYPIVGSITPWNFPLLLGLIDALPALYAGACVIVKPSEITPRWVEPMRSLIGRVDGLCAALDIVIGDAQLGRGVVMAADAVCFTGSVETGRHVAVAAATRLIPAFLELGGKDPLIVLASADLDLAVRAALRGSVVATGQACQSIERIYVAESIFDAFVSRLCEAARGVCLNWPDIGEGEIGPIISVRQADVLRAQLADARAQGAQLRTGGEVEELDGGLYLRPTVLTGVHHGMQVMRDETFGPLLPVMAFTSVEEAVTLANDSAYGLSAAVIAGTLAEAEAVGRRLSAGAVSLNDTALTAVFGEAEKDSFGRSGLGRSRMGPGGVRRFLRTQALIAQTGKPAGLTAYAEKGSVAVTAGSAPTDRR